MQLHCYTDQYNENCSMNWHADPYDIIKARSNVIKEVPGILMSSVNISVERTSIGTKINCSVTCNFTETTISATHIVDAHCKSLYNFFIYTQL